MPKNPKIQKVLVLGSGPIVIGQAAEFDYAGTQACRALKEEGVEVVLVNSNPATIMTDKDIADHVYIEPLNIASVTQVIQKERPDSILPTLGGQTGLNLAMNLHEQGILDQYGVRLLGTSPESIRKAEDRQGFKDAITMLQELDKKGYNPQNSKLKDLRQLFATGQLAMYYDQSWGFNGVQSINPEAKNFAATAKPLKGGSGNGASMLQAHILAYMDNGENQKTAARLFTEYLVTADQLQDYMTNITPAYPATKSMESMALNPVLEGAAGAIENLTTTPFIPTLGDLNLELCTLAQDVTVGGTDVDKAIESFRTAASNIIG